MRLIDADEMLKRNECSIYDTTDLKEILDNEPTASQWISCSDELPKIPESMISEGFHRVEVMATVKGSDVPVQLVWFDIENNEFYDDWDWFASKFNKEDILAWQALPEPYKEADSK